MVVDCRPRTGGFRASVRRDGGGKSPLHVGAPGAPPWYYWLTSHALIHGGVVGIVTGSAGLGAAESIAHWLIDIGKCEHYYGFNTDQSFHLVCKLIWIVIVLKG